MASNLRLRSMRPKKGQKASDFATVAVKYAAATGAVLYFSGWLYLYHFYRHFEIDVAMLQLSTQEVILHSAQVIQYVTNKIFVFPELLITLVLIPSILHLIFRNRGRVSRLFAWLDDYNKHYYIPIILALLVPALIITLARGAALEKARLIRVATGEIANFTLKSECAKGELAKLNQAEKLKLLAATQKWYFVYAQTGQRTKDAIISIDLFHVPTDCVQFVEFLVRHPK